VILELGYFLDKLGRERVVPLYREDVEIPSDFSGVLYPPYDSGGAWPYKLARELRESGYRVSSDDL
jgi:predicted nucleotide-binding protein